MIPRPFQKRVVRRWVKRLSGGDDSFIVAPTGAGKTAMLSFAAGELTKKMNPAVRRFLILQHREELVRQNMDTFKAVNPKMSVSLYTADAKSWRGRAVFGMVQTLSRKKNLQTLPADIDVCIIDECHHVAAKSYIDIIDAVREKNPKARIAGVTATPMRGDGRGLRAAFNSCADQVTISELIAGGFLVPPRAFVIDVGVREDLGKVRRLASDFDPGEVESVMNKSVINEQVVDHWREKAGNRKTIVFCSTIKHAEDVRAAFCSAGIKADTVDGKMQRDIRRTKLKSFQSGKIQVLVNVGILVEGFDDPTVSAVVLLRPCSFKSTMIQMIGRGLRIVDPKRFPGVVKKDCVVLDFGTSILTHGNLDADVEASIADDDEAEDRVKYCPPEGFLDTPYLIPDTNGNFGCGAEVPSHVKACPLCGFLFQRPAGDGVQEESERLDSVRLTEVDLLNRSPFRWVNLFDSERLLIASGFGTFAVVASANGDDWFAMGKSRGRRIVETLGVSGKPQAIAIADDFMRQNETSLNANKSKRWMTDPATPRQGELLANVGHEVKGGPLGVSNFSKLTATAYLNFAWNKDQIESIIGAK
jgi:DNA repair protein RadD